MNIQTDLFEPALPDGLCYRPEILSWRAEAALVAQLAALPLKPFDFHGYQGRREVVSFGWRYDYAQRRARRADPMPDFLMPLRGAAAAMAGLAGEDLVQALVTRYDPGTGIGWHRDKSHFGDVVGISLLSVCTLRFRRRNGARWERRSLEAQPRSAYLLRGPARAVWEHSIAAVHAPRFSVTFRTLVDEKCCAT